MEEKHNICILSTDHQPQYIGGIKRVTSILGNKWLDMGYKVYYMTLCNSPIRIDKINNIPQSFFPYPQKTLEPQNIFTLKKHIKENQIDILLNPHIEDHDLTILAIMMRKETNVKVVSSLHFSPFNQYKITKESFFITYNINKNPFQWLSSLFLWGRFYIYKGALIKHEERKWLQYASANSDSFITLSEKFNAYFDTCKSSIASINNPINNFANIIKKSKTKNVVWCGRMDLTGAKRIDRMLKVWGLTQRSHSDWKLQLLGSGDINRINMIIKKHHLKNIEVIGFCNPYDYYQKASIICSTSTVEGWGMVIVEGQQHGCVPIAFDSYESVHDIIEDGKTGLLIKPFDLNQYAERLMFLMDNEDVRTSMSKQAMVSVQKFDATIIAKQWLDLFNSITIK